MNKRNNWISLRSQYLLSTVSVAAIACAVFGILLFFGSVRVFDAGNRRQADEKLATLARNIGNQINAMETMSFALRSNHIFNWGNLSRNRFNDIVLLTEFARFGTGFHITDNFFMFYMDDYRVYRSSGVTNNFAFFVESNGFAVDPAVLYGELNAVSEPVVLPISAHGVQTLLLAYPVYTMGRHSDAGRATLGFILSHDSLLAYAQTLVGSFDGYIILDYLSHAMTIPGTPGIPDGGGAAARHTLTASSYSGSVKVSMAAPVSMGRGTAVLEIINAIYIALAALLVFSAAALLGYRIYRPIRRLSDKYPLLRSYNEIDGIESYLDSLLTQMDAIETQRQEQYDAIKQQTLRLLMGGKSETAAEDTNKYRANEVLRYVLEHYTDRDLSLDKLSDAFKLSNRYISSMIREATGLSYMDFLTGVRIRKAGELLHGGEHTVTEVCFAVGYVSLPHFTKTFKRVTGYTPSQFAGELGVKSE
jgi:AraC-like DNA-binding protein